MKRIVKNRDQSILTVDELVNTLESAGSSKPIVAQVYKGRVSVLAPYHYSLGPGSETRSYCFMECFNGYNSADSNLKKCIEKSVNGEDIDVYIFAGWEEFAAAVVNNGWKS